MDIKKYPKYYFDGTHNSKDYKIKKIVYEESKDLMII